MSKCYYQQEAILGESNTAGTTIPAMPSVLGHSLWPRKGLGGLSDVNQQAILCKMQIPLGPEMVDYSRYPSTEYFLVTVQPH